MSLSQYFYNQFLFVNLFKLNSLKNMKKEKKTFPRNHEQLAKSLKFIGQKV